MIHVSMLAMLGQFLVYVFSGEATYLRYISQYILGILVIYYMYCTTTFPLHCTTYLSDERKCRFVSIIWVELLQVLCDWGCKSCFWIVWRCLIGFLVLLSSFELQTNCLVGPFVYLYIVWLNRFCSRALVESFLNFIIFDWTVYLAIYCLLNCSPSPVSWNCHKTLWKPEIFGAIYDNLAISCTLKECSDETLSIFWRNANMKN